MSATTVATPELSDQTSRPRPRVRVGSARTRPVARAERERGPVARPDATRDISLRAPLTAAQPRGCQVAPVRVEKSGPSGAPAPGLRLTERGIAFILVVGAVILLAALTMIGLTALTVTGDGHAPLSVASPHQS